MLEPIIKTTPEGYESLFLDKIKFRSEDNNIAEVSNEGKVTGIAEGKTNILLNLVDKEENVNATVEKISNAFDILLIILGIILVILITIGIILLI